LKIARETRPTRDNIQIAIWGILLLANERRIEAEILMNGLSLRDPQVIGTLAAAGLCLGGVAVYFAMRKKPTAEEMERERRAFLVQTGRIIDGTLLDISELGPDESGRPTGMQLILYKYEIAGVVYQCSQDVSALKNVEKQLSLLVRSDVLTGVANRYSFNESFPLALSRARRARTESVSRSASISRRVVRTSVLASPYDACNCASDTPSR